MRDQGTIDTVHSLRGGGSIYRKHCRHYNPNGGQGESFFLYSATGNKGTWHIKASKAWADKEALQCAS